MSSIDDILFLLRNRLDARVGVGQVDSAEPVQNPHDLFLVDHDAVGLVQDFFEHGMRIIPALAAMFAVDVTVHHSALQRAGAIEREHGDQVADMVGLHALEQLAHAVGFQLENTLGVAALE